MPTEIPGIKIPKIKPTSYRVLVKMDELEETTEAGIIIARENEQRDAMGQTTGVVVALGPTAGKGLGEPFPIVGNRVYFAQYAGKKILDPDNKENEYLIMNDEDIIAVVQ